MSVPIIMTGLAKLRGTTGTATTFSTQIGRIGGLGNSAGVKATPLSGAAPRVVDYSLRAGQNYTLGASSGTGSIGRGGSDYSLNTGRDTTLGATSGSSGAVRPWSGTGNLGDIYGDSGWIDRGGGQQDYDLGGRDGDPGAIHRQGPRPSGLGATYGDSGSIKRDGYRPGALGAVYGDNGDISRTSNPTGLGATYGNSGDIRRGNSGGLSGQGLGATSGSPGAVKRLGGNSGYALGSRGGNPGAITRAGDAGSLRSGPRAFGSVKRRKPFKVRPRAHRDVCCGKDITGEMKLHVEWTFDADGNELPPVVKAWKAKIGGQVWTPPNWEDYLDLSSKTGSPDPVVTETTFVQTSAVSLDGCSEWAMDWPDEKGRLFGLQLRPGGLNVHHKITPAIRARGLCPVRFMLWPGG